MSKENLKYQSNAAWSFKKKFLVISACLVVFFAFCYLITTFCYRSLYLHNDFLCIRNIIVHTDSMDLQQKISEKLKCYKDEGRTLTEIDLRQLRNDILNSSSLLKEVSVKRIFPDTLDVTLYERFPAASLIIKSKGKSVKRKIDAEGTIMDFSAVQNHQLPILIIPVPHENFLPGTRTQDKFILSFLELIKYCEQSPDGNLFSIQICNIDEKDELLKPIMAGNSAFKNGAEITLKVGHVREQMDKIVPIVKARMNRNQPIKTINATFDNVPVTPAANSL